MYTCKPNMTYMFMYNHKETDLQMIYRYEQNFAFVSKNPTLVRFLSYFYKSKCEKLSN